MKNIYTILILATFLLVGCGNKAAKDEAIAYQTRVETDQAALNAEQVRLANEEAARQKAIDDAYWNNVFDSAMVAVKKVANFVVYSVGIALCVIALGGGWATKETVIGLGQARVARAQLEACLIHMDENTRTFPAFTMKTVGGSQFLTMLATGETFKLDEAKLANPLLIAALAQVSTTGVYAREASKAAMFRGNDVQTFNPTVIRGTASDIEK
jgi:hypothetical protein